MLRRAALAAVLTALAAPAAAAAQEVTAGVAFTPARAGAPAGLEASFSARGISRPPDALAVVTPRGMKLDPRAVRARCSDGAARNGSCPAASRIGGGEVRADTILGTFTGRGSAYLGRARSGEVAAVWLALEGFSGTLRASVRRSGGAHVLRVDGLAPSGTQIPPGAIREVSGAVRLDARRRTVTKRRRVRGRTRKVRTTYHLLRTPSTCPPGGWSARVELTTGGETRTVPVTAPCS